MVYNGKWSYEYDLKDHLGNTRVSFSADNAQVSILQTKDYYPFGLEMANHSSSTDATRYLYNGKELQDEAGLDWYDYGARFYDPVIGRFHSPDRFTEKYMGLTQYQYAANNPIKFIDLKGDSAVVLHAPEGAKGAGHMAILIQNKDLKWSLWSKNGTNESGGTSGPNDQEPGAQKGVGSFDSPEDFMNSKLNPVIDEKTGEKEYTEGYLIPATSEQDRKAETGAKKELDNDYNVVNSNCAKTVQSALTAAGKRDGSPTFWSTTSAAAKGAVLGSPFRPWGAAAGAAAAAKISEKTPNKIYERIKEQNQGKVIK